MRIATFNIAGIRARAETLTAWLKSAEPDVVCLQEIKCVDENFPAEIFDGLGYNYAVHGQKGFNGVAILSKSAIEVAQKGLPGDHTDEQARYLEVIVQAAEARAVRVASIYLPNGNPVGTPKFDYKLAFMRRLEARFAALRDLEEITVLAGDYNVIPENDDVYDPKAWLQDALFQPETRANYRRLLNLGYTDAIKTNDPRGHQYTFWDYQAGAWQKDHGIRIDHLLLSPEAADLMVGASIDRQARAMDKPSDHVPVLVELGV